MQCDFTQLLLYSIISREIVKKKLLFIILNKDIREPQVFNDDYKIMVYFYNLNFGKIFKTELKILNLWLKNLYKIFLSKL